MLWVGGELPSIRPVAQKQEDNLLDTAEVKLRDAMKSLKGSLRKGLRELAESKWLKESGKK